MLSHTAFGLPGRLTISVFPRMTDTARESIARGGDGQRSSPDGLGNAGGQAGGHGHGGLGGHIPGAKAGAAGGQDQIELALVGQARQGGLQGRGVVRQQDLLHHLIALGFQPLDDGGAALVLPLAPGALIAQGDDRRLPGQARCGGMSFISSPTLMWPPWSTLANTPSRGMMQSPTAL